MKRALKTIIPIVAAVLIITSAVLVFFFFRPDLTNNLLIAQANRMSEHGRYSRAITYYSWAWSLQPQRDEIPIKLAETYAASGNYTKAEHTLVKAISTHPQLSDLYVALSRIYVEQDKFLDAVQMLDRTTDAEVKGKLDAMRPAAPVRRAMTAWNSTPVTAIS